jgi:hypothetical protein
MILAVKIHPNFKPKSCRVWVFGRNKPNSIHQIGLLEALPEEVKHSPLVNSFRVRLGFLNLKSEVTSFRIFLMLPFRLNSFLEDIDRVDLAGFIFNLIPCDKN